MHRRVTISCLAAVISLAAPIAVQDSAHACDVASGACDSQGRSNFTGNVSVSDSGSDYSVSASDAYRSAGDAAGAGGFVPVVSGGSGGQWAPATGSGGGGGDDRVEECRRLVADPDPAVTTSCLYPVFRTTGPDAPAGGGPASGTPAVDPAGRSPRSP